MEQMTEQQAAQRSGAAKMARSGGGVSALGGHRGGAERSCCSNLLRLKGRATQPARRQPAFAAFAAISIGRARFPAEPAAGAPRARGAAPRARVPLGQGWGAVCVTCGGPHGLFGCEQLDAEMEAEADGLWMFE